MTCRLLGANKLNSNTGVLSLSASTAVMLGEKKTTETESHFLLCLVFKELHTVPSADTCCWFVHDYQSWRSCPVPRQMGHSEIRPEKRLLLPGVNPNHSAVATSYLWWPACWRWARTAWWANGRAGSSRAPRWRRGWEGLCRNRTAAGPWGGGGAPNSPPAPPSGSPWLRSRMPTALGGTTRGTKGKCVLHQISHWSQVIGWETLSYKARPAFPFHKFKQTPMMFDTFQIQV